MLSFAQSFWGLTLETHYMYVIIFGNGFDFFFYVLFHYLYKSIRNVYIDHEFSTICTCNQIEINVKRNKNLVFFSITTLIF